MEVVKFDWTISLGTLIHLSTLILVMIGGYVRINRKIDKLLMQHNMIWRWFKAEHGIDGEPKDKE